MTAIRICFVGDSITAGTGDAAFLGWPGRLCAAEAARGHDVTLYNLGVRADTSELIAARWRRECEARFNVPVNGALVFSFGVNDMAEVGDTGIRVPFDRSLATARAILSEAKAYRPVVWIGPTPIEPSMMPFVNAAGVRFDFHDGRTRALSLAYQDLARELGVPYLHVFDRLREDERWSASLGRAADGVHPDADGFALMAEIVGEWDGWRRLLA